ncbi:MAG: pyridoxal-phosphate dependent enzyme [Anaerolineae bacterium]|nr:pyridoxal-phosphate dependent enzyme [Anaerolineae bacterium]
MSQDQWQAFQGNLLTVYLMGASVKLVETEDHWDLEKQAMDVMADLEAKGRNPHYIPVSGTTPHSCLGYVRGALETIDQLHERDIQLDAVYTPFGTGGIFTAMLLTFREMGLNCPFAGISVNRNLEQCSENLETWWAALCDLLDIESQRERGAYNIYDEFIGREYGDPTVACLDAILMMGQSEGILLDPVYSGKMFSGFLAHHKQKHWQSGQNILLLHSGGTPALFAYHKVIEQHLIEKGILPAHFSKE